MAQARTQKKKNKNHLNIHGYKLEKAENDKF